MLYEVKVMKELAQSSMFDLTKDMYDKFVKQLYLNDREGSKKSSMSSKLVIVQCQIKLYISL